MEQYLSLKSLVSALVFSGLGLVVLLLSLLIFDKFTPGHLWKEILEEDNVALAVLMGAISIAMALIVSAAIHG